MASTRRSPSSRADSSLPRPFLGSILSGAPALRAGAAEIGPLETGRDGGRCSGSRSLADAGSTNPASRSAARASAESGASRLPSATRKASKAAAETAVCANRARSAAAFSSAPAATLTAIASQPLPALSRLASCLRSLAVAPCSDLLRDASKSSARTSMCSGARRLSVQAVATSCACCAHVATARQGLGGDSPLRGARDRAAGRLDLSARRAHNALATASRQFSTWPRSSSRRRSATTDKEVQADSTVPQHRRRSWQARLPTAAANASKATCCCDALGTRAIAALWRLSNVTQSCKGAEKFDAKSPVRVAIGLIRDGVEGRVLDVSSPPARRPLARRSRVRSDEASRE